jgi:hypothetical protein
MFGLLGVAEESVAKPLSILLILRSRVRMIREISMMQQTAQRGRGGWI